MDVRYFDFVFRGIGELDGVRSELEELISINVRLQNQNLENAKKAREERDARRQAAEEAKQAAMAQIQSELGVGKALESQKGIIEEIRQRIKLLRQGREEANDVASINKYNAALEISQKQLNTLTGATDKFRGSNGFWRDMQGWVVGALAVDRLADWGNTLVSNESKLLGQQTALQAVLKSNADYQNSLSFLSKLSNTYGQDLLSITGSYTKFIASSESSNLSLKERNRIYESVVKAGSTLKLSNDEINGSLLAVSQMFSKGNVQAEELRGQLGERLPGAFGLAAKAMGVSEQKLSDMLKAGQVMAVDLLPKLATELDKTFGAAAKTNLETISGSLNYAKNKVLEYFDAQNKAYKITDKVAGGYRWIADNLGLLVGVAKTAISTWIAYEVVTKASSAASVVWNGIQRASLIIKGEWILLTRQQAVANMTLTESELAAAAAAQTLSNNLLKNPFGLIVLAIGAAVAAYQTYKDNVEESQALTLEGIKIGDSEIKSLYQKKNSIDSAVNSLKGLKEGSSEYKSALNELITQYPNYFGKLNIEKSKYNEIEIARRMANREIERAIDLMARQKLSEKLSEKTADAQLRLLEAQRQKTELDQNGETAFGLITGSTYRAYDKVSNEIKKAQDDIKNYTEFSQKQIIENTKKNETDFRRALRDINKNTLLDAKEKEESIYQLKIQYNKATQDEIKSHEKTSLNLNKEGNDKAKKEKIDSVQTLALIRVKADIQELEDGEVKSQRLLAIDKDIAIQRINDSKASALKKATEIQKIEDKFRGDLSKLTDKYDDLEAKEQEKRNREWLKTNYEMHKDTIEQAAKKMAEQQKLNQKEYDEKRKLDEKVAKETNDLNSRQYELFDKMRVLDKISHAKNAEEIIKIENEENEKILVDRHEYYKKMILLAKLDLARKRAAYGDNSKEAAEAMLVLIGYEQEYTDTSINLTKFRTEKIKDGYDKNKIDAKRAYEYINQTAIEFVGFLESHIEKALNSTTDLVKRAELENQQAGIDLFKKGASAITDFASGNIIGGFFKTLDTLFTALNLSQESAERLTQARIENSKIVLTNYLTIVERDVESLMQKFDAIKETYGEIQLSDNSFISTISENIALDNIFKRLADFKNMSQEAFDFAVTTSLVSTSTLIEAEIKRGEQIQQNYNLAVSKEKELFEKRKSDITQEYDLEVQRINEKYDLISAKASQEYNAQTLAITAAGSAQLEALITNEASLASVRDEFAAKRLAVEKSFPLASKAITEDMTQAEIDAINASIKARDEQFAKIQAWYNDELVAIATSEGQKRKEYTDTEKIQNKIRDNLELAAIKFQGEEIQREKDKADEIIKAEKDKNDKILAAQEELNAKLFALEQKKNQDIADSFELLKKLLVFYSGEIETALKNSAIQGTEAYAQLANQLNVVNDLLNKIKGGASLPITAPSVPNIPLFPPIDIPTRIGGYKDGTSRLPNMSGRNGVDTELIKADVGERIIPTYLNNMLKAKFGSDITNEGLVFRAMNPTLPIMNYDAIANMNVQPTGDKFILSELKKLNKSMKEMKQVNVNVVNGHPSVEERSSNRMIKFVS